MAPWQAGSSSMNIPDPGKDHEPGPDAGRPAQGDGMDLEHLLEQLPGVYAGWEQLAASAELERIRRRIEELMARRDERDRGEG